MRLGAEWCLAVGLLAGGCEPANDSNVVGYVEPYNGDPKNFTSSGYSRHSYAVRGCDHKIEVKMPFQITEDGFGKASVRVPLDYLDDPSTTTVVPDGTAEAQSRLSFDFPSLYRGTGMKDWFAQGVRARIGPYPRPLSDAVSFLASPASRKVDGTAGQSRYLGLTPSHRQIAMSCSATDWPNPICEAEIEIGSRGRRFLATFSPRAVGRLNDIISVGERLFAEGSAACDATSESMQE